MTADAAAPAPPSSGTPATDAGQHPQGAPRDPGSSAAEARSWLAAGAETLGALLGEEPPAVGSRMADILAAVLDTIPSGVLIVDREARTVYQNRAARERIGPVIACSVYLDGDVRLDAGIECPSASALFDGRPHVAFREVPHPGGERSYLEMRSTPLFDRRGRLAGALTVVCDETARVTLERERAHEAALGLAPPATLQSWPLFERERARYAARLEAAVEARTAELERTKEMLRNILDGIPDMITLLDATEGKLIFANAAAQGLPGETIGALKTTFGQTSVMAGRTVTRTVEHTDAEGRTRVFESFAYPVPSMQEGGTLSIHYTRDITERRALEQQAIRNERLAVVGELAAGLAHEIRTPLTSISNSVKLLEGVLPTAAGEDTRLVLGIIAKEAKRLSALLTDFLKFARPRPPRPVPTDLNSLVCEAVGIARCSRPQAEKVVVDLELTDDLPEAPVDRDQLQQALLNVVTNALEACLSWARRGAGRVVIRTAGPGRGRSGWEITVSDNGPGIMPEDRKRLFEPFFSKKADGTGLGLAITKRIVDAHGGRIDVASSPEGGCTFTVVLPAASGAGPLQGA